MKRTLAFLASLFLGTLAASAQSPSQERFENRLLEDVVRMTAAELSDATIVAYVRARHARLGDDVTADDLIRLRRIGVSEKVVAAIARLSGISDRGVERGDDRDRDLDRDRDRDRDVEYDGGSTVVPVDPGYGARYADPYGWPSVYDGYPGWGYPYPYWYDYSPFFYGGVFSFRGGGRFHGGGGDHRGGGRRGDGPRGAGDDKGGRGDTSRGGSSPGGASRGSGHSGSGHSGSSHSGSGHSGGGHSGGGHGRR
ncbi:MAG: hypothetical protein M3R62_15115 [Acidobacteriota bacterium]|nr:hypothetical protein [Acidobacteriota bacterium]